MQTPGQQSISPGRRVADFFGLKRNLVILLVAIFVIGAGEELWMRFVPKYLQALGASVFIIGLYDALRTVLAAAYAYPGGIVADSWGHRRAFITFNILSIAGYSLALKQTEQARRRVELKAQRQIEEARLQAEAARKEADEAARTFTW